MLYFSLIYPFLTCLGFNIDSLVFINTVVCYICYTENVISQYLSRNLDPILNLYSNLSTCLTSVILFNHRYSLLFINGHVNCYLHVSVNTSNLPLLFIPIQHANLVMEPFITSVIIPFNNYDLYSLKFTGSHL